MDKFLKLARAGESMTKAIKFCKPLISKRGNIARLGEMVSMSGAAKRFVRLSEVTERYRKMVDLWFLFFCTIVTPF